MTAAIRIGTRASALATTQSRLVGDRISATLGREVELVEISTEGDRTHGDRGQGADDGDPELVTRLA